MEDLTFFFTDIEDSTAMWEKDPEAMQSAIARHDSIVNDVLGGGGGRVYKGMGDGVCAVFERPEKALRASLDLRHALSMASWATKESLRVRIAIATGEAGTRAGDYFGPAINLVSRLLSLCPGGRTLLGGRSASAARDSLPANAQVLHLGWYRLKGIEAPVEVAELTVDDTTSLPAPDSAKAYRVVRVGDRWRPVRDIPNNLVPERDQFIGRESALRGLAERLAGSARLVTVLGTGGVGKTRLVRHFAAQWLGEWPGGVYFCDLSDARSLEGIHYAVSMALGVPLGRGDAGTQLGHAIAGRGNCLVILDNFEQVHGFSTATLVPWLDQAPEARFVVTSRQRLQLAGESVFTLEPMDLPTDAMALFVARARAQRPDFEIDTPLGPVVSEIVRLLDGVPLAIELAAARVRVLSPEQIVERMHDRFVLLAGSRAAATRQGTLKAAIDWSWGLLAAWEQDALAQCAVFEGGFDLPAAENVLRLPADAPPVIDVIQGLLDKSLLRSGAFHSARGDLAQPRFGMYISIHDYAAEESRELGERHRIDSEQRHGRYFAKFGADAAIDALTTHGGIARRYALATELDNLLSACRRAVRRSDGETAVGCFLAAGAVLEAQGPFTVAEALGREVAALPDLSPGQAAKVLTALAQAMFASGHAESAIASLRQALARARTAGDRRAELNVLRYLATTQHLTGRRDEAHEAFEAAFALCGANDRSQHGVLLGNLANLQMEQGRMDEADRSYHAALAMHREVGNRAAEGIVLGNLGTLHHDLGHLDEARVAYEEALVIHRESGSVAQQAITLGNLGLLVNQTGHREQAAAHYRTALSIHRDTGNRRGVGVILKQMGEVEHELGEFAGAQARYDEALAIFREIGNRRFEGGVLGDMAELAIDRGRPQSAVEVVAAGERIFREIDDPLALADVLCAKGRALASTGEALPAYAALAEAEAISTRLGVKADSPLQHKVQRLREMLAGLAGSQGP